MINKKVVFDVTSYTILGIAQTGFRGCEIVGRACVDLKIGDKLRLKEGMCMLEITKIICFNKEHESVVAGMGCKLILKEVEKDETETCAFWITEIEYA